MLFSRRQNDYNKEKSLEDDLMMARMKESYKHKQKEIS